MQPLTIDMQPTPPPLLGGRFHPLGWTVPASLTKPQWIDAGRVLVPLQDACPWWIGDWWAFADHKYGDRIEIVRNEGWNAKTLANHGSVSRAYPETSRRREVPWSHHAALAGLPPSERGPFFDLVVEPLLRGGSVISYRELRAELHRHKITIGDRPSMHTCTVDDLKELVAKGRKFHTIYADPPWRHPYSPTWGFGFQQFETMTIEDIMALPIRDLVAPDAHLHIWIVPAVWWRVKEIVESWGFDSSIPHPFSWYKDGRIGMGNIWRGQHETMLSFWRGNARYANDKSVRSVLFDEETAMLDDTAIRSPRLQPSEKPDEVRSLIEKTSPPNYLELFGRKPVPGWTVYGDQISKEDFWESGERPDCWDTEKQSD
jgi:N6-adenosine-specific RNA methylase IME4